MTQHVVIRREEYVAGTFDKPEVRVFTQTHASRPPIPWDKLSIGDIVWMKWSGGPIVAKGVVDGLRQVANCTPDILRSTVRGTKLYELDEYWNSRPPAFFGMAIFIKDEEWLGNLIFPAARSFGDSWIVLDTETKIKSWLTDAKESEISKSHTSNRQRSRRSLRPSVRFEVLRRDNFTCQYCGRTAPFVKLQVDHIIPKAKGGSDDVINLVTACQECNIGKGAKSLK